MPMRDSAGKQRPAARGRIPLSPKQPIDLPLASLGRYFCFVASLANAWIGTVASDDCTLIIER